MTRRLLELVGMLMVGDGMLSLLEPKRHCLLWEVGPGMWRDVMDEFAEHPGMTRVVGLVELVAGLALASMQKPTLAERARFAVGR